MEKAEKDPVEMALLQARTGYDEVEEGDEVYDVNAMDYIQDEDDEDYEDEDEDEDEEEEEEDEDVEEHKE
jgi:hypothetical protein